jgi:UDP-2,3-diacylglucosamine pyrophosphatase LpxH
MWDAEEIFVLSDLHLAAERDKGLFRSDVELAACLRWMLKVSRDSHGLVVLAGDVLDFLVLKDGSRKVDFGRLGEQTRGIIEHHPEVFDALGEVARSPRHQLVILGGNHDCELIFPAVQEAIERRLGGDLIKPSVRWLVHGEALRVRVGEAVVLVEHGNALDPWNRIDHPELYGAFSLATRNLADASDYQPPLGSQVVLDVVNQLRDSYQWIDCLKPGTEAVLPLLWHVAPCQHRKLLLELANDYQSKKKFAVNRKLGNVRDPDYLYKGKREAEDSPKDRMFDEWEKAAYEEQQSAPCAGRGDGRLINKLRSFFEVEQLDDSCTYLEPVFAGGADLVVHGHTHSAKLCVVEGGLYINTGTWGQLLRLPGGDESDDTWQGFLDLLRRNDVECFGRPTFARIRRDGKTNATTAALLEWRRQEPRALSSRRFSGRQTGWRKE